MFVRDFVHVARPFEAIAPRFLRDPRWLRPIADEAVGEAARVSEAIAETPDRIADGVGDPGPRSQLALHLDRGAVRTRTRGLVVPISWSDGAALPWFPPLSGDLEIAPIGLSQSALVLSASYPGPELLEPPSAADDRRLPSPAADHAMVQRVVEAGVRAFLLRLASTLEREHPQDTGR